MPAALVYAASNLLMTRKGKSTLPELTKYVVTADLDSFYENRFR
jgi:UDP-N-acetylglucosamine:LPS N-acetylglucosamine transferase